MEIVKFCPGDPTPGGTLYERDLPDEVAQDFRAAGPQGIHYFAGASAGPDERMCDLFVGIAGQEGMESGEFGGKP